MSLERVDYVDTFITVAPDFAGTPAVPEPRAGKPTVASATFERIHDAPYAHTSGDVIFGVWADRRGIPEVERAAARREFYAKPQACLRGSDLGKKFGWGIHADHEGHLAVYAAGSPEYERLAAGVAPDGSAVTVKPALRARRASSSA